MIHRKEYKLITQSFRLAKKKSIKPVPLDISKEELQKAVGKLTINMVGANGIGIAGPQIGLNYKIALIVPNFSEDYVIINPTYEPIEDERVKVHESCLSVNKERAYLVERYPKILAKYYTVDDDYNIVYKEKELDQPESIVFQHETDHLNGITINKIGKRDKSLELFNS